MTKLVCQNNISSIFIVKFTIRSLENLKISDNIPPDRLNSWLDNAGSEIKTVSVSRRKGCQVQWVCSYLIVLLLYPGFTLHSPGTVIPVFSSLCLDAKWYTVWLCDGEVKYVLHNILYSLTQTYYKLSQNKLFTNGKRTKYFTLKSQLSKKGRLK